MDLLSLNDDALALILLNLQPADFYRTCQVHPRITKLCNNWYFQQRYEEKWHPEIIRKLNNEFKHHPERAFHLAGRLNDINLVKYLMHRFSDGYYNLCESFEGAGYSGSEEFIRTLWIYVDEIGLDFDKFDMINIVENYIVEGAATRGNWDLVEHYRSSARGDFGYLVGLVKGNHINRFIDYLSSLGDISNQETYAGLPCALIHAAAENSDPQILYYLLQKYPHMVDDAAKFALGEGKTVLYKEIECRYQLMPDPMYVWETLFSVYHGGSRSVLDFILERVELLEDPHEHLSGVYEQLVEINPVLVDILNESAPNIFPSGYLRGLIASNKCALFVRIVDKLRVSRENLTLLKDIAIRFRNNHIVEYLDNVRVQSSILE